ncbi:MAG: hypothetical protein NWR72_07890 [Bacteroidia bacterium]|nr:hypothetical protein [Bacteroidia bacterium]
MRITLSTPVAGHHAGIMARFDRELFEQLSPPGAKVDLIRFDGSETGDLVHIRLHLPLMPAQNWISKIVDHGSDDNTSWFVDEGKTLPWFLSAWQHRHVVKQEGDHSLIIDDIRFTAPLWLPDFLLYPVLWAQFAWRRPVYRRVFGVALPSSNISGT